MGKIALILVLLAVSLLLGPALLLWAVGHLAYGEGLDFNLGNWAAAVVILILLRGSVDTQ